MTRYPRFSKLAAALLTLAGLVLGAAPSSAAPKDKDALKLDADAMNNDYLATNFADAERKLKQAQKVCGKDNCSPKVLAQINRDLGVVYIGGLNKPSDGEAAFVDAIKADSSIELDKDLTTPDIQKAWDAAKKKAAGGGKATPPSTGTPPPGPAAGGDIVHTPAAEQVVNTPLPVYCELPEDVAAKKVQVKYKPFGATDWKSIDMKKLGSGFGAEVPCAEVSTTGDLAYYIQAVDESGDVVANSGSRSAPHKVPIRNTIAGDAPHLPGKAAPAQCAEAADCPPDLPGCPKAKKKKKKKAKGWGDSCDEENPCDENLVCKKGTCENAEGEGAAEAKACEQASDCDEGQACVEGKCEAPSGPFKKNWLSLGIEQDIALISGNDVCLRKNADQQIDGSKDADAFRCFKGGESYQDLPVKDRAGTIQGGVAIGTTRVLVGYDRVFGQNITVGGRLGYVLRGAGPQYTANKDPATGADMDEKKDPPFLPFHVELRGQYFLGKTPFAQKGTRPYLFLGGGMAQVDSKVTVQVQRCLPGSWKPDPSGSGGACTNDATSESVDAWRRMGQSFIGFGGGVVYAPSGKGGLVGELKIMYLLPAPTTGIAVAPTIGYVLGL